MDNKAKYIDQQREVCKKSNLGFVETDFEMIAGVSGTLFTSALPINGLRHPLEGGTCGWYLWAGDWSEDVGFFKPYHVKHLLDHKPEIIKYLGLEPGSRFLIDNNGYEDIWFDAELLNI